MNCTTDDDKLTKKKKERKKEKKKSSVYLNTLSSNTLFRTKEKREGVIEKKYRTISRYNQ